MSYRMTVSPDFTPDHIPGWYIFNTWFQKKLGEGVHLELFNDFESQRKAIAADEIDLIYANPYDASMLVREKGFKAVVRPVQFSDEAVIAVSKDSPVETIEDLEPGIRVVSSSDPDINMIGMIMLEPADLDSGALRDKMKIVSSYPLVAQQLLRGQADVGFFLKEAYEDLTELTRRNLRVLVASEIGVIHHSLLVGPGMEALSEDIQTALVGMADDPKGAGVLESLGLPGWEALSEEDVEFMIDLMDTLC